MALTHLGQRTITSLNEASEPARRLNLIFATCRDAVLEDHDWSFARKMEALAEVADVTVPGWDYVYAEPARCVKVRKIFNDSTVSKKDSDPYDKVLLSSTNTKAIVTNTADAYARYTFQVTDTTLFSPSYIQALSLKLAADSAQALTGDINKRNQMLQYYQAALDNAKMSNKVEAKEDPDDSSSFIDAR